MKKKIIILVTVFSVLLSAYKSSNFVWAVEPRVCIGDDCPTEIKSHYHYTDAYELGIRYVTCQFGSFTLDYEISTYLEYEDGLIKKVSAPIFTFGEQFRIETAGYTVDPTVISCNKVINSSRTSATITLVLSFQFNDQYTSDPVTFVYTAK